MNGIMNLCCISLLAYCGVARCNDFLKQRQALKEELSKSPYNLVCEGYENDNWDIFFMHADGSNLKNLTNTPTIHELYPKVSPDGKKVSFLVDTGKGRTKIRSVWIMDIDGKNRKKVSDYARQPFWSPDGKILGWLPQEYKKFSGRSLANRGIKLYNVATGKSVPHVNSDKIFHLFNPCWSPDGKWIVSTVHAGMGIKHGNVLIEANGTMILNLHKGGCRPDFSPDGKWIAWGRTDRKMLVVPFVDAGAKSHYGKPVFTLIDNNKKRKIYHVDWSPNGKWLAISWGPTSKGDPSKVGTFSAAAETPGVYAAKWNLVIVPVSMKGEVANIGSLKSKIPWLQITTKGSSYKEPDWIRGTNN